MSATPETSARLHEVYVQTTGVRLPWNFHRQGQWEEWIRHMIREMAAADIRVTMEELLETVIRRRRRMYAEKPAICAAMIRFGKLAGNPDECLEDYLQHVAETRPRPSFSPGKAAVLRSTGREDAPPGEPPKIAADLIKSFTTSLRAAAGLNPDGEKT